MKIISVSILIMIALVSGFLFAGIMGTIFFAIFNSIALLIAKPNYRKNILKLSVASIVLVGLGYLLMIFFGLLGANPDVHQKVSDIKTELIKQGYNPRWFIISQKRNKIYNKLLINSVTKSKHLQAKAIDLYIIDIDGDGEYNKKDFDLIKNAALKCQQKNPETKGNTFDYFGRGYFSHHMVHVEVL